MTDAYANEGYEQFEFHDLCLWLEREHEWLFTAQFEGVTIIAATNPDPDPAEIIDELLHKAKEARARYRALIDSSPSQQRVGDPSVLLEEMGDEEALREFRRKRMTRNLDEGDY